jgi:cysteine desulfurase
MGVGALVAAAALPIPPLARGGGQERGRRPGTEGVPQIVGFGAAAETATALGAEERARVGALRDALEAALGAEVSDLAVHGCDAERVANTSCLSMPTVASETQVMAFDLAGVAVSAGSACSSGKVRQSHVLTAMGVADALAGSAVRFSLGWASQPGDVDRAVAAWLALYRRKVRAA